MSTETIEHLPIEGAQKKTKKQRKDNGGLLLAPPLGKTNNQRDSVNVDHSIPVAVKPRKSKHEKVEARVTEDTELKKMKRKHAQEEGDQEAVEIDEQKKKKKKKRTQEKEDCQLDDRDEKEIRRSKKRNSSSEHEKSVNPEKTKKNRKEKTLDGENKPRKKKRKTVDTDLPDPDADGTLTDQSRKGIFNIIILCA